MSLTVQCVIIYFIAISIAYGLGRIGYKARDYKLGGKIIIDPQFSKDVWQINMIMPPEAIEKEDYILLKIEKRDNNIDHNGNQ